MGLVHSSEDALIPTEQTDRPAATFQITAEEALRALHVHHAGPELLGALQGLVSIIKAAGIYNLSRGVALGPMSWSVKCADRLEEAERAMAKALGGT